MPFLVKTGGFERHWLRAERKANANSRARDPPGVCWLCMAGTPNCPFEDVNLGAAWATTPNLLPWRSQPPLLRLYHSRSAPWEMFMPDIFHNYHGGVGMYFIASSIVECLSIIPGTIDEKVEQLAVDLQNWSQKKGNRLPHSGIFSRDRVGLTSWQVLPEAKWSKFDDTRVYHSFLQSWLESRENQIQGNDILCQIAMGVRKINRMFHILYTSGLWMESSESKEAAQLGQEFLHIYCKLAHTCFVAGRLRYPMVVKMHMIDHQVRKMKQQSRNTWSLNVLAAAVQADEVARLFW